MEGKVFEPNHIAKLTASLLKAPLLNKHLCRRDGNFQAIFYAWVKVFSALSSKKKNWGFIWIYSSLKYSVEIWGRGKKSSERGVKIILGSKKHIIMKKSEWALCASYCTSFSVCWCLYLWHMDTVNYIYCLWKRKRPQNLILHPSDPEVTEYWGTGKTFSEEEMKARFLLLSWKED